MHAQDSPITQWEVLVHPRPNETVRGVLRFINGKPILTLDAGEVIDSDTEGVTFSVEHEIVVGEKGDSVFRELKDRVRIVLKPCSAKDLPYAPYLSNIEEHMYPSSTRGWYGRYKMAPDYAFYSTEAAQFNYLVHNTIQRDIFWLTIIDSQYGHIYESHLIYQYEIPILNMMTNIDYRTRRRQATWNTIELKELALSILDGAPPSWEDLSYLARGVSVQGLSIRDTMGESLDQLVPISIPEEHREQIKAFLALTLSISDIPNEDPVELFNQYMGTPLLRQLLLIHLLTIAKNHNLPDYVALMFAADRGELYDYPSLEGPQLEVVHKLINTISKPPFYKCNWKEIIRHIAKLNESKRIELELPISKSQALRSKKDWLTRLELEMTGAKLHVDVRYPKIGLTQLVYLGAAHTWPHRHLEWMTRLKEISVSSPSSRYFQLMVMPPSAAEQIKRAMSNISEISWSARRVNHHLFDVNTSEWKINIPKILSSVENKTTLNRLKKEFNPWTKSSVYQMSLDDAYAVDAGRRFLYLATIAYYPKEELCGYKPRQLAKKLEKLRSLEVISISYEALYSLDREARSYVTVAEGHSESIYSLTRAFLLHTPTTLAFLQNDAKRVYLISRLSKVAAYKLFRELPVKGESSEIRIRINEIYGYRNYQPDLLQRILTNDDSWSGDVSQLLSQIRLLSKYENS